MISSTTAPSFWESYRRCPAQEREAARKAYRLWSENPQHPSLRFKPVGLYWSVRITRSHRALARYSGKTLVWLWIGPHDEYERLIA